MYTHTSGQPKGSMACGCVYACMCVCVYVCIHTYMGTT